MEKTITSANFDEEVLNSDRPVLIDFWASWCGPCKMMAPLISEIAEEHPEIKVGKVNVDEEIMLATKFNVMSIPFFAVFRKGEIAETTIGAMPKEELLNGLNLVN